MDWGEVSETYLEINKQAFNRTLHNESEAQTRFDVIDRIIKEILQWKHGQISVEERNEGKIKGFVDYILRAGDNIIVIEAKKVGATFPSPTKKKKLKLTGPVLGQGEINDAILQAESYAQYKKANVLIVTNGDCWCFYPFNTSVERNSIYANILFPFKTSEDAEALFNYFSCSKVEQGSIDELTTAPIVVEKKLIQVVVDSDARIGRNNIADYLSPALDDAFYSENILRDEAKLKWCFVATEGRKKFDTQLHIHLNESKPITIKPAPKLRRDKSPDEIISMVSKPSFKANPVTLIIGTVGSGKTTYLKHFELVRGKALIEKNKSHWIYLDFEGMGKGGNPRKYIYEKLNDYLLQEHPHNPTDYRNAIEPAYEEEIKALARGPYARIFTNKPKFEEKVSEVIHEDFLKVEPYVRKVLSYLSKQTQCVVVLDNIDLYEDEELETNVLSEAISISKNANCHVIVSIRDNTYINHRNDSIMNAFELKRLWIDPPPFKEVLSKRLSYSKSVLKGVSADIILSNSMKLYVQDLSIFFDLVQSSLLDSDQGKFLEALSDRNIRKGILLVKNFLTSGHVHADLAIKNYINGETKYRFPYHEVFKGSVLGTWTHYKEDRAEIINLFNSELGSKKLLLLRLHILQFLFYNASASETKIPVNELVKSLSVIGMSSDLMCKILKGLQKAGFIRTESASELIIDTSLIFITMSGAYCIGHLCYRIVYIESVLMDTPIYDDKAWNNLTYLTQQIEREYDKITKMKLRADRLDIFLKALEDVENYALTDYKSRKKIMIVDKMHNSINNQITAIISKLENRKKKF